jgi:serine/threonine protein phosphatase 1
MSTDIYAIGDIHGHLESLERLLERIQPDLTQDQLIFMGDYIDRGPYSKGVVDYVLRLKDSAPPENVICLKGNHEAMFLNFLQGNDIELFLFNGGLSTIRDYWGLDWEDLDRLVLPPDHEKFYRELKLYHETDDYIFVHGGLKPGVPLAEQDDFGRKVIFGHTPFKQPLILPNKIGIDTGAAYGNLLTCLKLPQEEFFFDRYDD